MNTPIRFFVLLSVAAGVWFASPLIFAGLWIGSAALLGEIDEWRYQPTTKFNAGKWQEPNLKYRYAVLDHVIQREIALGMTREEIEGRLGQPDYTTESGGWQYEAKRPGSTFIDFSGGGLLIKFGPNGRALQIMKNLEAVTEGENPLPKTES